MYCCKLVKTRLGHSLGDGQVLQLVHKVSQRRLHMEAQLLACTGTAPMSYHCNALQSPNYALQPVEETA